MGVNAPAGPEHEAEAAATSVVVPAPSFGALGGATVEARILALQRTAGNAAVQRLIKGRQLSRATSGRRLMRFVGWEHERLGNLGSIAQCTASDPSQCPTSALLIEVAPGVKLTWGQVVARGRRVRQRRGDAVLRRGGRPGRDWRRRDTGPAAGRDGPRPGLATVGHRRDPARDLQRRHEGVVGQRDAFRRVGDAQPGALSGPGRRDRGVAAAPPCGRRRGGARRAGNGRLHAQPRLSARGVRRSLPDRLLLGRPHPHPAHPDLPLVRADLATGRQDGDQVLPPRPVFATPVRLARADGRADEDIRSVPRPGARQAAGEADPRRLGRGQRYDPRLRGRDGRASAPMWLGGQFTTYGDDSLPGSTNAPANKTSGTAEKLAVAAIGVARGHIDQAFRAGQQAVASGSADPRGDAWATLDRAGVKSPYTEILNFVPRAVPGATPMPWAKWRWGAMDKWMHDKVNAYAGSKIDSKRAGIVGAVPDFTLQINDGPEMKIRQVIDDALKAFAADPLGVIGKLIMWEALDPALAPAPATSGP